MSGCIGAICAQFLSSSEGEINLAPGLPIPGARSPSPRSLLKSKRPAWCPPFAFSSELLSLPGEPASLCALKLPQPGQLTGNARSHTHTSRAVRGQCQLPHSMLAPHYRSGPGCHEPQGGWTGGGRVGGERKVLCISPRQDFKVGRLGKEGSCLPDPTAWSDPLENCFSGFDWMLGGVGAWVAPQGRKS